MGKIKSVQIFTVVQEKPKYSWSPVMPDVLNTDTIIRITDEDGFVGVGSVCTFTEYGPDKSVLEQLRPLALNLLREDEITPQDFWAKMQHRRPGVSNIAIAAMDIALWDLAARQQSLPLYKLLGGARDSIPAYASVPILDGPHDYIAFIHQLREEGFSIFKFHYKSIAELDLALIKDVHEAHGDDCQFMFDAENLYPIEDAKAVASEMADRGFLWLEAPFDDHDWASYKSLKSATELPILPAGNSVIDVAHLREAVSNNCWSSLRIDAATAGGITPSLKIFELGEASQMNVELQSWGSSISTAANLHLALAHQNSTYFEIPVPRSDFHVPGTAIFAMKDGLVSAPEKSGIGLNINWQEVAGAASATAVYEAN